MYGGVGRRRQARELGRPQPADRLHGQRFVVWKACGAGLIEGFAVAGDRVRVAPWLPTARRQVCELQRPGTEHGGVRRGPAGT